MIDFNTSEDAAVRKPWATCALSTWGICWGLTLSYFRSTKWLSLFQTHLCIYTVRYTCTLPMLRAFWVSTLRLNLLDWSHDTSVTAMTRTLPHWRWAEANLAQIVIPERLASDGHGSGLDPPPRDVPAGKLDPIFNTPCQ